MEFLAVPGIEPVEVEANDHTAAIDRDGECLFRLPPLTEIAKELAQAGN